MAGGNNRASPVICMCIHKIIKLAAKRREKGPSNVVAEALELHLDADSGRTKAIESALALKGSMSETEAAGLSARTLGIRANW